MKGLTLAVLVSPAIFVVMTGLFRYRPELPRLASSLLIYAVSLLALLGLYFITPRNLGFLPDSMIEKSVWLDILVAWFALSASFFGGWLQFYKLTSRGYSLRILIDLLQIPQRSTTPDAVVDIYADGHGLTWMYDTRINGLLQTGLISDERGQIALTRRGRKAAHLFSLLRALYLAGTQKP